MNNVRDLIELSAQRLRPMQSQGMWTKIAKVFVPTRMVAVNAQGYHGPRKVDVVPDINMGSVVRQLVYVGDSAYIEQDQGGRWWCTKVKVTPRCDPVTPPVTPNVPLPSIVQTITADFRNFTPFISPLQTFNPPVFTAGMLSPAGFQLGGSSTYDVGGGYPGMIPASDIAQGIGLVNGATWTKWFVSLTGTDAWSMALNGTTIASGSGSASGFFYPALTFASSSKFGFYLTASGSSSDLYWGCGA